MKDGTLYGIGVGPGDPELMTVKGARLLGACRHVFVPKASDAKDSLALAIAGPYLGPACSIHELVFPMSPDPEVLNRHWGDAARQVARVLAAGEDACFLTLGDPLLYSTYVYLLRALRLESPGTAVVTVPGVNAFSAAAALAGFSIGEAKEAVTIVPTADDLGRVRQALEGGGTVVLMKIGRRLPMVMQILGEMGLVEQGVFVARAGLAGQQVETDLRRLEATEGDPEAGYLSVILVHTGR